MPYRVPEVAMTVRAVFVGKKDSTMGSFWTARRGMCFWSRAFSWRKSLFAVISSMETELPGVRGGDNVLATRSHSDHGEKIMGMGKLA
jgi:hypothetical protein